MEMRRISFLYDTSNIISFEVRFHLSNLDKKGLDFFFPDVCSYLIVCCCIKTVIIVDNLDINGYFCIMNVALCFEQSVGRGVSAVRLQCKGHCYKMKI